MKTCPIRLRRPAWLGLLLVVALAPTAVLANSKDDDAALRVRYDREREICTSGRSNQDRATCLREANAAFAQARKGDLNDGAAPYTRNATVRCEALRGDDRQDCVARMNGEGTTTGSVAAGVVEAPAEVRK